MGFHSHQNGTGQDSPKIESEKWKAFPITLEIWNSYLKNKLKPQ